MSKVLNLQLVCNIKGKERDIRLKVSFLVGILFLLVRFLNVSPDIVLGIEIMVFSQLFLLFIFYMGILQYLFRFCVLLSFIDILKKISKEKSFRHDKDFYINLFQQVMITLLSLFLSSVTLALFSVSF
ncbi:hypothetical protein D6810_02715 [Candidatus Dojkabacteria bacterium]|uniref:Uncharacterized protein n=1 Tax=Candidatus Dojkabacteria bacterium TaxID=2099670 RepID=A0A3M0YZJ6_9BACT|nr:MAG: hypothetical protein D6810_02715 [Candidatus Dojkabacteria bacterium]